MALELSTAGIKIKYAVETNNTKPNAGFLEIPEVKSIPEFGTDINTLQTTPLSATRNHTYIAGLSDSGGAFGLTVNDCPAFRTAWETCVSAFQALSGGNRMWFEIAIPEMSDSFYFPGRPAPLGFGGADVDEVLENTANIIPEGDFEWAAASAV